MCEGAVVGGGYLKLPDCCVRIGVLQYVRCYEKHAEYARSVAIPRNED